MFNFENEPTLDLTVIIPFVQEFPQVLFTLQSAYAEFYKSGLSFELIAIDNWCTEVKIQEGGRLRDSGGSHIKSLAEEKRPWLRYLEYDEKLSHWQSKNLGVSKCRGKYILFMDSHCILPPRSASSMVRYYMENEEVLNGTLHLPITYMLENQGSDLNYKLVTDMDHSVVHYAFTRHKPDSRPYRVPCMSTCGMLMPRKLFSELGGWPRELGIYGGGENFINFTLAVLGYNVNIYPKTSIFHYAAKRGYHWNHDDYHRNRCIASYMYGGKDFAENYIFACKGKPEVWTKIFYGVITKCSEQQEFIEKKRKIDIFDWVAKAKDGYPEYQNLPEVNIN